MFSRTLELHVPIMVDVEYRAHGGGTVMMKPSRFLTEIDNELTEPMLLENPLGHLMTGETPSDKDTPPLLPKS